MISMTSRPVWCGLLSLAILAGAAQAQVPTEAPAVDPLCGGLSTAIAAADQQIPFIILVPANQSLGDLPRLKRNPAGFEGFNFCHLYRAGNATQGTVGGGPHNYLRCSTFSRSASQSPATAAAVEAARTESAAAYDALAARAKACLEPAGWTASGGERTRRYEDYESLLTFTRDGTANDIVVRLLEDNSSPGARSKSTHWSVDLTVRNPNTAHPKQ